MVIADVQPTGMQCPIRHLRITVSVKQGHGLAKLVLRMIQNLPQWCVGPAQSLLNAINCTEVVAFIDFAARAKKRFYCSWPSRSLHGEQPAPVKRSNHAHHHATSD